MVGREGVGEACATCIAGECLCTVDGCDGFARLQPLQAWTSKGEAEGIGDFDAMGVIFGSLRMRMGLNAENEEERGHTTFELGGIEIDQSRPFFVHIRVSQNVNTHFLFDVESHDEITRSSSAHTTPTIGADVGHSTADLRFGFDNIIDVSESVNAALEANITTFSLRFRAQLDAEVVLGEDVRLDEATLLLVR